MKVLKFRTWCKSLKFFTTQPAIISTGRQLLFHHCNNNISIVNLDDDSEYIVQQFTGLLDKTGIEIYEGDILLQDLANITSEVKWSSLELAYIIQYPDLTFAYLADFEPSDIRVVGNIFEYNELIIKL